MALYPSFTRTLALGGNKLKRFVELARMEYQFLSFIISVFGWQAEPGYKREVVEKARQWLKQLTLSCPQKEDLAPLWVPKNTRCINLYDESRRARLEDLRKTKCKISKEDWELPGEDFWANNLVPHFTAPASVETHVNIEVWRELAANMYRDMRPGWERKTELANIVLAQLKNGTSSGVSGAGLLPINVPNFFENPEIDPPRVFDALLKDITNGTIAGPLLPSSERCFRING